MPGRRPLKLASIDDVMPEVDRLLRDGYDRAGNWSLGQICHHLSGVIRWTVEGFPVQSPWLFKTTIGRLARRHVLGRGTMPEGVKLPAKALPPPDLDDRAEAEALRASLRLFLAAEGPFDDHPFFGNLSPEEWRRYHAIHSVHHLSFLVPKEPGATAG